MNRARAIIRDISIQKQGEINFFQVKLPKNSIRIIGIETDSFLLSAIPSSTGGDSGLGGSTPPEVNMTPFLKWDISINPTLGKLKLQSFDRSNIFFEEWVDFVHYGAGMPDMSFGNFPVSPYTLNNNKQPRTADVSCTNQVINGMFIDYIGSRLLADLPYTIKVIIWVETDEKNNGLRYDFQKQDLEIKH
jgi:hypothetical protein